jgi:hypothetical protein
MIQAYTYIFTYYPLFKVISFQKGIFSIRLMLLCTPFARQDRCIPLPLYDIHIQDLYWNKGADKVSKQFMWTLLQSYLVCDPPTSRGGGVHFVGHDPHLTGSSIYWNKISHYLLENP